MSIGVSEASLSDIAAVTNRNDGYCNDMFGGNGAWWLIVLLLFGWGRGGYGFGGGYGGGSCVGENYVLATDFATIERKLDGINNGICDATFQLTNNLNGNFRTLDGAICNLGYQALQNTNAIQSQLAGCCCDIQGAIKDVAYGNAMNANAIQQQISSCCCDIEKMNMQSRFDAQAYNCNTLQAIDKLGDRIIDYMSNEKVQSLRDENFALRLQASQAKQNEYLISRLDPNPCPTPAYVVQPPQQVTFPTNCCGTVNYAAGGCGGCGSF
jgi:hypothetical protein